MERTLQEALELEEQAGQEAGMASLEAALHEASEEGEAAKTEQVALAEAFKKHQAWAAKSKAARQTRARQPGILAWGAKSKAGAGKREPAPRGTVAECWPVRLNDEETQTTLLEQMNAFQLAGGWQPYELQWWI